MIYLKKAEALSHKTEQDFIEFNEKTDHVVFLPAQDNIEYVEDINGNLVYSENIDRVIVIVGQSCFV